MNAAAKLELILWMLGEGSANPFLTKLEKPLISKENALVLLNLPDDNPPDEDKEKVE